jgi:membrane-associated phospholipid phosphatase
MLLAKQNALSLGHKIAAWVLPEKDMPRRIWPVYVGLGYIAVIFILGGLRPDHVYIGMLCLLDYYNSKTRLFLSYFFPFILTGVVFDSMRYFYWQGIQGHVHVAEPYFRDKALFGIAGLTPNEFWDHHVYKILDLLCGFAYLTFVAEYLCAAFILFFTNNLNYLRIFGWCFFTMNVMGFITYFIYPAAPPWYVSQYGLGPARMDVHPSAASAVRFDQILGTHFFDQIYGRGVDVFGAYPSLHVAYPFLVVWASFKVPGLTWMRPFAVAFYLLMCFSAVYLQHHYVVDLMLGTLYSATSVLIVRAVLDRAAQRTPGMIVVKEGI